MNNNTGGGEGEGGKVVTLAGFESSRVKQLSSSRKSNPANTCVVGATPTAVVCCDKRSFGSADVLVWRSDGGWVVESEEGGGERKLRGVCRKGSRE